MMCQIQQWVCKWYLTHAHTHTLGICLKMAVIFSAVGVDGVLTGLGESGGPVSNHGIKWL